MATFKDINLQIGTRLQMTLQHGPVYYTEFIGYVEGEYLIVKIPFENGLSIQVQLDEQVTMRIFAGVEVFTLICKIKTIFKAPYYYMHLSFPTDIKSVALRGAVRAKVKLPAQVNGKAGVIIDISATGAGIIAGNMLGQLNEEALITFDFPIKPSNQIAHIDVHATIRSVQHVPGKVKDAPPKFSHGVSFHELDLTSQVMLLNLVYESMNRV